MYEVKDKKAFVERFIEILGDEGDMFWSMGNTNEDFELITSRIKLQGYWVGNSVRYLFDENLEFQGVQARTFGA